MKRTKPFLWVFLAVCVFFLSRNSYAQFDNWNAWLTTQIRQHPEVVAAREQWLSANAGTEAMEQPLYNPELLTELERSGDADNYRVGVQQTIDWWDKRRARKQQASYLRAAAKSQYQQVVLDKTSEALIALTEWQAASKAQELIEEQQAQLDALLSLVEKRKKAGDLGGIDAELTFLSLSTQLTEVADVEANLQKAQAHAQELLAEWSPAIGGIPSKFWMKELLDGSDQGLRKQPLVASAEENWHALSVAADAARLSAKAEPTIGINAGRDGEENVVSLSFSIPLHVRNNYSAESRAAVNTALEAEAKYRALLRKQRFEWRAALAAWQRFDQQYQRWQSQVKRRLKNSETLLKRQWTSGDLSTAEYLLALNQRAGSLLAGIEMEKQTRLEFIEVLLKSGRLIDLSETPSTLDN